ncbi:oxysterol-binding protein-related protein 1C [Tanacetum coccineum]|uniref:Oxysterol-binding protein-related protein 1C n=1 Tax=Tanacetum coccineum TaxID=301880 RepID=A0ABQ5BRW4_9ASTR
MVGQDEGIKEFNLNSDDGEAYQWSKVTTSIHNLILGKLYCDHYGMMRVQGNQTILNRGSCKFGDRCKFIHDHRNRAGLTPRTSTNSNTASGQGSWGSVAGPATFGFHQARQAQYPAQSCPMHYQPSPVALVTPVYYAGPIPAAQHAAPNQPHATTSAQQLAAYTA